MQAHGEEPMAGERMVTALLASALAACSMLGPDREPATGRWALVGETPDGEHLLVETSLSGVAAGCSGFGSWEVEESPEAVRIVAHVWHRQEPDGCTLDLVTFTHEVHLERPLADRHLIGCDLRDCHQGPTDPTLGDDGILAAATDDVVAVARGGGIVRTVQDGTLGWQAPLDTTTWLAATPSAILVADGAATVSLDAASGRRRWRIPHGRPIALDTVAVVCDGEHLVAHDAGTGLRRWGSDLPCGQEIALHDGLLATIASSPTEEDGRRLTVLDGATGAVVLDTAVQGVGDQHLTILIEDGLIVLGGHDHDLVVVDTEGRERYRQPDARGAPIAVLDGVAVLQGPRNRLLGVDLTSGEVVWERRFLPPGFVDVAGGTLLALDARSGEIARLAPRSGEAMWSSRIGITGGFAAARGAGGALHVATTLSLVTLDPASGGIVSWTHLPYVPPDPPS